MLNYLHVDVFSNQAMSGNGLTVVFDNNQILSKAQMQLITQEFRQFETIFLSKKTTSQFFGRVFTLEEELNFAGHPILGASACIHEMYHKNSDQIRIELILKEKVVDTLSKRINDSYFVEMNQGRPKYLGIVPKSKYEQILKHLNLHSTNVYDTLPIEVISTGLPYMIIPLKSGLKNAKIVTQDFEAVLNSFGAKFVYLFDVDSLETRSWDNLGRIEDVATGSAAGPLCAFLVKNGLYPSNTYIDINQGKFVNRPSVIKTILVSNNNLNQILISGTVSLFASGSLIFTEIKKKRK